MARKQKKGSKRSLRRAINRLVDQALRRHDTTGDHKGKKGKKGKKGS